MYVYEVERGKKKREQKQDQELCTWGLVTGNVVMF